MSGEGGATPRIDGLEHTIVHPDGPGDVPPDPIVPR